MGCIQDKLHKNEYNRNLSTRHSNEHKHNKNTDRQHQKIKWVIFTYSGKETKENYKTLQRDSKRIEF
jgi:hypothetical protein